MYPKLTFTLDTLVAFAKVSSNTLQILSTPSSLKRKLTVVWWGSKTIFFQQYVSFYERVLSVIHCPQIGHRSVENLVIFTFHVRYVYVVAT